MIDIVWGTRPEVIKLFPVVNTIKKQKVPFYIINSHQHYDQSMMDIFYQELGLDPETVQGHDELPGEYTKLVVQGDTRKVFQYAYKAKERGGMQIFHVEYGL